MSEKVSYDLSSYLSTIKDCRRGQGQRYPLVPTLMMIIMSVLSAATGYREMAAFMKRHESALSSSFGLKHGVPSHVSIRAILLGIGFVNINRGFLNWMRGVLETPEEQWVSGDGKALRSTLRDAGNSKQTFVQLVSIFSHNSRLVLAQKATEHSKAEEAQAIRDLIAALDKEGLIITLDALHCQKKL